MADWTSGYFSEINYTFGAYGELNPLHIKYLLTSAGFKTKNIKYACELGFGYGVSLNISAATSSVIWTANDFNPEHVSFAQELNSAYLGKNIIVDDSFEEFVEKDHPKFDFIALHGVWSWVSKENRNIIIKFLKKNLSINGMVYIGYNSKPGWASFLSVRDILISIPSDETKSVESKLKSSVEYLEKIIKIDSAGKLAHPTLVKKIDDVKTQPVNYIAHEYFNKDWCPMNFNEVHNYLKNAKLSYATSAEPLSSFDAINLTTEQAEILNNENDIISQQMIRDFFANRTFRKDIWIKGGRRYSSEEQYGELSLMSFFCFQNFDNFEYTLKGLTGEANLSKQVYEPIINLMKDGNVRTLREIHKEIKKNNSFSKKALIEAISVLVAKKTIFPAYSREETKKNLETTRKLNKRIIDLAKVDNSINFLASPVTGSSVSINFVDMLFVDSIFAGETDPGKWADHAWNALAEVGQVLNKNGKKIESPRENKSELLTLAKKFLPSMKKLEKHKIV